VKWEPVARELVICVLIACLPVEKLLRAAEWVLAGESNVLVNVGIV